MRAASRRLYGDGSKAYRIEAAITFAPEASPFPGVDTNPVLLLVSRTPPCATLRRTEEARRTGLSRPPSTDTPGSTVPLGQFCRVMRGIATGDNAFFFMTNQRRDELGLPYHAFLRAVGRTRDQAGDRLTIADLDALDRRGRPTFLLSLDGTPKDRLDPALRAYLSEGENAGLPRRALIQQRSPWYRMEKRQPPEWLFAYLGRRNCRFVRNEAGVVPLTGFLCVYALNPASLNLDQVTAALNDPRTLENLVLVAKSYGGGALKVEPRALERLAVSRAALGPVIT